MPKKTKVKLGLKNLAMLSSYFDYIFVHLRQKARLRARIKSKIFVNFRPEPGRNPNPTRKPGPTYNSDTDCRVFNYAVKSLKIKTTTAPVSPKTQHFRRKGPKHILSDCNGNWALC